MKSKLFFVAALSSAVLLSGCSINIQDGDYTSRTSKERQNRTTISKLVPGMQVGQVTALLGVPDFNELYNDGDDRIQVLFYRTHRTKSDGITTKEECTPLILKNGELVEWGEKAYYNVH